MSIVQILNSPFQKDFKQVLKDNTVKPQFLLKEPLKAPPLTKNYSIVGQGFDYLLRTFIEMDNFRAKCDNDTIAERAYKELERQLDNSQADYIRIGYCNQHVVDKYDFHIKLMRKMLRSMKAFNTYYITLKISDALLKACLFYARLDLYVRAGLIDIGLAEEETLQDVQDLRNLLRLYKMQPFHKNCHCVLNPHFGDGSALVGGADIDISVDDMLLEVKTTSCTSLKRIHFDQVFCYYILYLIGGIHPRGRVKKMKRIGIYYARHGKMWQAKISDIATEKQIETVKQYMLKRFI